MQYVETGGSSSRDGEVGGGWRVLWGLRGGFGGAGVLGAKGSAEALPVEIFAGVEDQQRYR